MNGRLKRFLSNNAGNQFKSPRRLAALLVFLSGAIVLSSSVFLFAPALLIALIGGYAIRCAARITDDHALKKAADQLFVGFVG